MYKRQVINQSVVSNDTTVEFIGDDKLERIKEFNNALIKGNVSDPNERIERINAMLENRKKDKLMKLGQLKQWIMASDCRKSSIASYFKQEFQTKTDICCDRCGATLDKIIPILPKQTSDFHQIEDNWRMQLKQLFSGRTEAYYEK